MWQSSSVSASQTLRVTDCGTPATVWRCMWTLETPLCRSSGCNKHGSDHGLQSLQTNKQKLCFPLLTETSFYCKTGQKDIFCTLWARGFIPNLSPFYAILPQEAKIWKINVANQQIFFLHIQTFVAKHTLIQDINLFLQGCWYTMCWPVCNLPHTLPLVRVSLNCSDPLGMPWLPQQQTQQKISSHWSFHT